MEQLLEEKRLNDIIDSQSKAIEKLLEERDQAVKRGDRMEQKLAVLAQAFTEAVLCLEQHGIKPQPLFEEERR